MPMFNTGPTSTVTELLTNDEATAAQFYTATRERSWSWPYPAMCLLFSLAALPIAVYYGLYVENGDWFRSVSHADVQALAAKPLFATFCAGGLSQASTYDAIAGGAAHFSVAHISLLTAAVLTAIIAALTLSNVLGVHRVRFHWGIVIAAFFGAILAFYVVEYLFAAIVRDAFEGLNIFPKVGCEPLDKLRGRLAAALHVGVRFDAFAVFLLAAAAAALAWRFETSERAGRWSRSYVLRHKLRALLTLFFLGSLLLVSANLALNSLTNVWVIVLDEAAAGQQKGAAEEKDDPAKSEKPDPLKHLVAAAKNLRSELLFMSGVVGSLLLVGLFTPAFYSLTSDIEVAGRTQAASPPPTRLILVTTPENVVRGLVDAVPGGDPNQRIASYAELQKWREDHGLSVTFPQITGSLIAGLAPVLSGGIVDAGKTLLGG